jgi:Spy/CpxP family protein refolding chaperone
MKKYAILVLAAVFMLNLSLMAQDPTTSKAAKVETKAEKTPEQKKASTEKRVARLAKDLSLTDAERAKVLDLFVNQDIKGKKRDAELKKIIGDEKFAQYQKMHAEKVANKKK